MVIEMRKLALELEKLAVRGLNIVRCRVSEEESWFAYSMRLEGLGQPACTAPQYVKNWGKPVGYGHLCIEPTMHEVYGMALPNYILQATKGLREGAAKEWLWTLEMEWIKPALPPICEVMDGLSIDRICMMHFSGQPMIGEGYAYAIRNFEGTPCQYERNFTGRVNYSASLISLAQPNEPPGVKEYSSVFQAKHTAAIDDVLKKAGLEPTVGYAGGPRETKAPFREMFRRAVTGITAIKQC